MSDNTEVTIEDNDDVHADILKAMEGEKAEPAPESTELAEPEAKEPEAQDVPPIEPPTSWKAEDKEKFKSLPRDVQETIKAREDEVHKGFTKLDEERNLGKQIKEVVTPYMAIIQAEGGTPVTAVRDLLNTAYLLRTAPAHQKTELVKQICQTYGVDMSAISAQSHQAQAYQDPTISQLQQELAQVKQFANPEFLQKQLQEKMENDRVMAEVEAFASNPEHIHYQQVKPIMAGLLSNGAAKDMKEAYDMACHADPHIRSTIEAQKAANIEAQKKTELAAKKKAAVSVSGSSGTFTPNSKATNSNSIEDDIRAAMEAHGIL